MSVAVTSVTPKCLLVDDLPENITALSSLLQNEGVEIHAAQSGTEALEMLLVHEYALALVDVQMPEMDGFELAEIMRSTLKTKTIPIIFVTAADHDVKRVFKGYEAGAVDFLFKPLYPQIVLGKVKVFLELFRQKCLVEETLKKINEQLELKVQERTEALMIAQKEIEAFSYSVSHDLRAPLRSMDGFSKALLTIYEDKLDERGKDYLQRIRGSAQKMGDLIDGMLLLSRLGRQEIKKEKINLTEMALSIIEELRKNDRSRSVEVNVSENLETIGDPTLMRALLENLLQNSWKYTSHTAQAVITFRSQVLNKKKTFIISDNGAGFDMKYVDKLFDAFQRLHDPSEFNGMGIGLATTKRIIERHAGKIWAEAEVGKGATFYFYLG